MPDLLQEIEHAFPNENQSHWRLLLDTALPAIDFAIGDRKEEPGRPFWTIGGGTALALQIEHRLSFDIDVFVSGIDLSEFTPAENPAAKLISPNFQWPGHYLKFELPQGEIDFLQSGLKTKPGFRPASYRGRIIAIETPEEIVVKKIRYRAAKFTERDAFDLAAVATVLPSIAESLARYVPDQLASLRDAVEHIGRKGPGAIADAVKPTQKFADIPAQAVQRCLAVVEQAYRIVPTNEPPSKQQGPSGFITVVHSEIVLSQDAVKDAFAGGISPEAKMLLHFAEAITQPEWTRTALGKPIRTGVAIGGIAAIENTAATFGLADELRFHLNIDTAKRLLQAASPAIRESYQRAGERAARTQMARQTESPSRDR